MALERRASVPRLGGLLKENKDRFTFLIYVVMISIQFAMSFTGIELSLYFRLAVLIILFLTLVSNPKWMPFVLTLFWGTSLISPLPMLPTETYFIFIFTIAIGAIHLNYFKNRIRAKIIIMVAYFLLIALITVDQTIDYTTPLFLIIPVALVVSVFVNDEDDLLRLLLGLMLMSLFLATLFLLRRDDFSEAYKSLGVERSSWTNSNMFGGCIAVGMVCAVGYILDSFQLNKNRTLSLVAIATVFVSIPALILNASRGALLAALATCLFLLLFSRVKLTYRIIVTIVTVGFTIYLYNSGIFELLEARIGEQDFETGGNRLPIWTAKFQAFNEYGIVSWIFGVGQPRLRYLGVFYSTHNDFITALIGYGAVGLVLFLLFLFSPFKMAKNNKITILCLTVLLLVEGIVLEPIFRGLLPFYMYYIMLYKYASLSKSRSE